MRLDRQQFGKSCQVDGKTGRIIGLRDEAAVRDRRIIPYAIGSGVRRDNCLHRGKHVGHGKLLDFVRAEPLDPEAVDYLVHITTDTYVTQIWLNVMLP